MKQNTGSAGIDGNTGNAGINHPQLTRRRSLEVDMRELAHNVSRARASSVSIHAAIQDLLSVRLTVEGETFRSRAIAATPSP